MVSDAVHKFTLDNGVTPNTLIIQENQYAFLKDLEARTCLMEHPCRMGYSPQGGEPVEEKYLGLTLLIEKTNRDKGPRVCRL